ncbi:LOW QUALITY PROTEIN: membrane-spanning 4-domains subfamily A member 8-like [Dugong dugon]
MNSMASAGPMANSMFVVTPHNGYPVVPGVMSQIPLYPSNQPQVHLIPGNPPGQTPYVSEQPARRVWKEGKVLGALLILTGLIHIGFGSILATVLSGYYIAISFYGGFPFWGSICFILSGSLSVSAETQPESSCPLSGSVGMNIVSAISSAVGIMLFITDISIAAITFSHSDSILTITSGVWNNLWLPVAFGLRSKLLSQSPGMAISCVLLVFCLLEFCIACTASPFGCQLTCYPRNNVSSESRGRGTSVSRKTPAKRMETGRVFMFLPPSQDQGDSRVYEDLRIHSDLLSPYCVPPVALVFLGGMVFPNVYTANKVVVPEPENPPPEYSTQVPGSK